MAYLFLILILPNLVIGFQSDVFRLLATDENVLNCAVTLSDECVADLGRKPVESLFKANEIRLGKFFSVEKLANASEGRGFLENVWGMKEIADAALEFLSTRALKLRFGSWVARLFKSPTEPDSVEVTFSARRRGKNSGFNFEIRLR